MSSLLHVDLSKGRVRKAPTPPCLISNYLGGNGLAVRLFLESMGPSLDAFHPENILVISPGLFNGILVNTAGKVAFLSKSPLSGTIAESIMGGCIGSELKQAGLDAVVIKGKCSNPSIVSIDNDEVTILDGRSYWGEFSRETTEAVQRDLGDCIVASIGPAGENLVRFASIDCEDRQAGRGGLGAVMGSKNLKAIAVRGDKDIQISQPERLEALDLHWQKIMVNSAAFVEDVKYGTGEFLDWLNKERGVFPTKNWQESVFDDRRQIDPYYWAPKYVSKCKGCVACTKTCGKLFLIQCGPYAGTAVDGVEYETLYSLGGECGNPDIEAVARANELCDQYGMDTISAGVVIGFAMELVQRGILKEQEIGADCRFGDGASVVKMVELIGRRKGMGRLLGEGVQRASEAIGKGSDHYAMHVRGMEPPAYDVRGMRSMALSLMTSPRGADHLRSGAYALDLTGKMWKFSTDRLTNDDKGRMVKELEDFMIVYDSLGVCKFSRKFFWLEAFPDLLDACFGMKVTEANLLLVGERVSNLKQLFNLRSGWTKEAGYLPKRVRKDPIKEGVSEGAVVSDEDMHIMLDDYMRSRDWDEGGVPKKSKLRELGIEDL